MKKTLILLLSLSMVSVASAATNQSDSQPVAPVGAAAPSMPFGQYGNAVSMCYDHTTLDYGGDEDNKLPGFRIANDSPFAQWQNGYFSLHVSFSYGAATESHEYYDVEETIYTTLVGADAYLKISPKFYAFAGPRLGLSSWRDEVSFKGVDGKESSSKSFFVYGLEGGIRYFINDRWSILASLRYIKYQEKDGYKFNTTSFSIGAGWAF